MRKLLKYLKDYKKECVLAPLFKMLEAVFELAVPVVIAGMIDNGIRPRDPQVIFRSFGILIILAVVGLTVSCTAQFFAAKAATGFAKGLRHDLFGHILSFGFSEIDSVGTSTLITRQTSDVNILQNGVNMFLRLFLRSPFIVAGALVMSFIIDTKSAAVFAAVILLLSVAVTLIMKNNIPLLKKVQKRLDDVLYLVRENLSGIRVIRAFTLEDEQIKNFRNENEDLTATQLRAGRVSALLNPLTYVLVNLGIVLLIYVGTIRVRSGYLTGGQVVALYNYMSQILLELIKFANLIIILNRTIASAARVNEIFDTRPVMDVAGSEDPFKDIGTYPAIEFENVSLRYHEGADEAISDISFSVDKGMSFGIIGGTGSGKTTVASLIPRFYDATQGSVKIFGRDIRTIDISSLRKNIGIVMQKSVLFEGTIRDNLAWANPSASDEELLAAADAAVCREVIEQKGGLDGRVESGGRNFSGGQRQRLCIARVLAGHYPVIIFDDSSSALDYMTDKTLRKNIRDLDPHPTVIIISQRSISVADCDRILVMDDGNAVGVGTHSTLLKDCDVYRQIHATHDSKEAD